MLDAHQHLCGPELRAYVLAKLTALHVREYAPDDRAMRARLGIKRQIQGLELQLSALRWEAAEHSSKGPRASTRQRPVDMPDFRTIFGRTDKRRAEQ